MLSLEGWGRVDPPALQDKSLLRSKGADPSWGSWGGLKDLRVLFPSCSLQTKGLFPLGAFFTLALVTRGITLYVTDSSHFFSRGHIRARRPPWSHELCDQEPDRYVVGLGGTSGPCRLVVSSLRGCIQPCELPSPHAAAPSSSRWLS